MLILEIPFFSKLFYSFSVPFCMFHHNFCFFFSNFNWLDNYFAFVVTLIARVMMMYIYILHNCYATKHFNLNSIFNVTTFLFLYDFAHTLCGCLSVRPCVYLSVDAPQVVVRSNYQMSDTRIIDPLCKTKNSIYIDHKFLRSKNKPMLLSFIFFIFRYMIVYFYDQLICLQLNFPSLVLRKCVWFLCEEGKKCNFI